jgi:putative hydrolase of the HAD superfamily
MRTPDLLLAENHYHSITQSITNYQNFIFDVGNVLLLWDETATVRKALPERTNPEQYIEKLFSLDDWSKFDQGLMNDEEAAEFFSKKAGLTKNEVTNVINVSRELLTPITEGFQLLNTLHALNKNLYCLTNMPSATFKFLSKKYDFWKKFLGIVVSGDIKMIKPDPKIFQHILSLYNLDPAKTMFFDDNVNNINASQELGIKSILFTRDLDQIIKNMKINFK